MARQSPGPWPSDFNEQVRGKVVKPLCRIWVPGKPKGAKRKGSSLKAYRAKIRELALAQISAPLESERIIVEIWFCLPHEKRADVDNIAKPILDTLKGVVYVDDRQVRQV